MESVSCKLHNVRGEVVGNVDLPAEVFRAKIKPQLVHDMCRAYLDQLRKTRALLARRPVAPLTPDDEDALIARLTRGAGKD